MFLTYFMHFVLKKKDTTKTWFVDGVSMFIQMYGSYFMYLLAPVFPAVLVSDMCIVYTQKSTQAVLSV